MSNYWNKWTFPRHSNLLRSTCTYRCESQNVPFSQQLGSVSDTVCMNMQRESSPFSLPVTSVISKMAMSIKLKDVSLFDPTIVQSSLEFIRQIFINWQQLLNLGDEQSIWVKTDRNGSSGKLMGSKTFSWQAAHFFIAVSYGKHTWKQVTHGRCSFVRQSISLLCGVTDN